MLSRSCIRCGSTRDLREREETRSHTPKDAGSIAGIFHPILGLAAMLLQTTYTKRWVFFCAECLLWKRTLRRLWVLAFASPLFLAIVSRGHVLVTMGGSLAAVLAVALLSVAEKST